MPHKDPEKRREYDAAKKRLKYVRLKGERKHSPPCLPPGLQLETAADAIRILWTCVQAIDREEGPAIDKGRAIAYLISVALRAIESGDIESRIARLEALLRQEAAA